MGGQWAHRDDPSAELWGLSEINSFRKLREEFTGSDVRKRRAWRRNRLTVERGAWPTADRDWPGGLGDGEGTGRPWSGSRHPNESGQQTAAGEGLGLRAGGGDAAAAERKRDRAMRNWARQSATLTCVRDTWRGAGRRGGKGICGLGPPWS